MAYYSYTFIIVTLFLSFLGCSGVQESTDAIPNQTVYQRTARLSQLISENKFDYRFPYATKADTIIIDSVAKNVTIGFSREFGNTFIREHHVDSLHGAIITFLGLQELGYGLNLLCGGYDISHLVPNAYRHALPADLSRLNNKNKPAPFVTQSDRQVIPSAGLYGNTIVIWHSHGWIYSAAEKRWDWQRPRLFQTAEDRIPMSFVLPYLIPMIENAGAYAFLPRERDTQINEVVVDNDDPLQEDYTEVSYSSVMRITPTEKPGFKKPFPYYDFRVNPFELGTARQVTTDTITSAEITWKPTIPEDGYYSVSISYQSQPQSIKDASYTVHHSGGSTSFLVDQSKGGSTWIYLGTFHFLKASDQFQGVKLTNRSSEKGRTVTFDACRFGGGMGIITRDGKTSGRPKFLEGAMYSMQYAGMPDTLVYTPTSGKDDFRDDYLGRGEYVNFIVGDPAGPNKLRNHPGLGIPVDLSLAFHTDAGITTNNRVVGTLSIYSLTDKNYTTEFPSGQSRWANRDLADIIQTEITDDLRSLYDTTWTRRALIDSRYSEAMAPNVPSMLLELLSHQNLTDMKFFADPQFRFDVSRAMYKAILRFIAAQEQRNFVVQPLPPIQFATRIEGDDIILTWQPQTDPLEPGAQPDRYMVYIAEDNKGFQRGIPCTQNQFRFTTPKKGVVYSIKVTAINEGGESFPTEVLAAAVAEQPKGTTLIINGFDRICGPSVIESDNVSGFANFIDEGVPDRYDYPFTGEQYDFDPKSEWITNQRPGHGASTGDHEVFLYAGNTHDFSRMHAQALLHAGYSSFSMSDEAAEAIPAWNTLNISVIDYLLGEEKSTPGIGNAKRSTVRFEPFNKQMQKLLTDYLNKGGRLFVSGSYCISDLILNDKADSVNTRFAHSWLKADYGALRASSDGLVQSYHPDFQKFGTSPLRFNTEFSRFHYKVEAPGGINPVGGSETILYYKNNEFSAGTGYKGRFSTVILGFPFESVVDVQERNTLMQSVINYLVK